MVQIHRFEICAKASIVPDVEGMQILTEIRDFGIDSIKKLEVVKIYKLEGNLSETDLAKLKSQLFLEPLWQKEYHMKSSFKNNLAIEIAPKLGVTNTEIESLIRSVADLGIQIRSANSSKKYIFYPRPNTHELDLIINKILMNKTIEEVLTEEKKTFLIAGKSAPTLKIVIRNLEKRALEKISVDRQLWLSSNEMKVIQDYFNKLHRDPTDCELETLAQTWSEHCFHKTFKSPLKFGKRIKPSLISRIKKTTMEINSPECLIVFDDNAGIINFDNKWALCAKTETHNSPSAIEPYGGSMTGVGGVFRDIAGCGQSAANIAGTDIFCFADPKLPYSRVPPGCLHPKRIMQKCVAGVRDYGNRMGIPTINGSFTFDSEYRAKPVVLVGAYGIIPKKNIRKNKLIKDDLVVSVGGKTGRDGIHGVTFASGVMTDKTRVVSSQAVQIGNPIEEKRMFDALLFARDLGLIKQITDCGGGGYSSAVGEMGKEIGVRVNLAQVPLKYPGLSPWEIWLSESQERMIVALSPAKLFQFKKICKIYNTQATVIGSFSGTGKLELYYKKDKVADMDMDFLHHGVPIKTLAGRYRKKRKLPSVNKKNPVKIEISLGKLIRKVLSHPNIASKEEVVRRYDHEVQGRLVLKPYSGVGFDSPMDAAVIKPLFSSSKGAVISHGLSVSISKIDPYWGGVSAVDEAVRQVVTVGADPGKIFLLDNFIFPYPDKETLGDLDLAVEGLCFAARTYKSPFISGKDSLSGTYKQKNQTILVPPTVIVSTLALIGDIYRSISSDLKNEGNELYLVGGLSAKLGGSILSEIERIESFDIPKIDPAKAFRTYLNYYQAVASGFIQSGHDVSEGGIITAILEMAFGSNLGVDLDLSSFINNRIDTIPFLFSEAGGRIIIETKQEDENRILKIFGSENIIKLGKMTNESDIRINHNKDTIICEKIKDLKNIWQLPFKKYF